MSQIHADVQILLWVLIIVSIVSIVVRRIKLPYTLGLIITGLAISGFKLYNYVGIGLTPEFLDTVAPEIFLLIFLPGLLFEGAMNIDTDELFRNIKSISLFAILGVLTTVLIASGVLHYVLHIPYQISLLFAAMVTPTDPIAVMAIFKKLGVSKKLGVLLEGEALFNDGTGLVIFKVVLALIVSGSFSLLSGIGQFLKLVIGGIFVGALLGYVLSKVLRKIRDSLVHLALSTVLAYGSFLVAEQFHFSGVISVVTAGFVMGGYGLKFLSSDIKLELASFWSYVGFILNSLVFLLIGLEIEIPNLIKYMTPILIGFLAILIGRAIAIYVFSHIINKVDDSKIINNVNEHIPGKWQHVLVWGGLHGGLSMVLVLSLPIIGSPILAEWRDFLISAVFGTVLVSLVLQGTTMVALISKLQLTKKGKKIDEYESEIAKIYMHNAGEIELNKLMDSKVISKSFYNKYKKDLNELIKKSNKKIHTFIEKYPSIKKQQTHELESSLYLTYKESLMEGHSKGLFSKEIRDSHLKIINDKLFELSRESH